ncbi:MAG: hypothetical protein ABI432_05840 [Flavobacteriales bacterium]
MWRSRLSSLSSKLLSKSTSVIALVLIGLVYFLGIRSERTGFVREVLDPSLKRIAQPVLNAFRGRPPAVMQLHLALGNTTLDSLATGYAASRSSGWLDPGGTAIVGRCAIDERATDAYITLRPGRIDPEKKNRWPFQVLLQRTDTVLRIQSFDLVPVNDDTPLRMWLLSSALQDQGLPSFSVELVEVQLNERNLGLYRMEERLDSATLSRWARGKGPVVRFDDELRSSVEEAKLGATFPVAPLPQEDWLAAPIMAAQGTGRYQDASAARRYQHAVQQLEGFRSGRIPPADVFDVAATARLFALCDVLGGQQATSWWNMRFLLDSLSERLIAVPQHGASFEPITTITALQDNASVHFPSSKSGFRDRLFGDAVFFRAYIACLDTFSTEGWLESLLRRVSSGYNTQERIVVGEYPQPRPDASVFAHNRDVVIRTLRPPDLALAYAQENVAPERELALANVHALPVEVTAFIAGTDTVPFPAPLLLWPREPEKPLIYSPARIRLPRGFQGPVALLVNVLGMDESRRIVVRTWSSFTAN